MRSTLCPDNTILRTPTSAAPLLPASLHLLLDIKPQSSPHFCCYSYHSQKNGHVSTAQSSATNYTIATIITVSSVWDQGSTAGECPHVEVLRGRDGRDGRDGAKGERGEKGDTFLCGEKGEPGEPGEKYPWNAGIYWDIWSSW